jgi:2'-5' RNA ligase
MASDLVIVAIPAADDDVWTVSSEKAPHLTLLVLGDAMSNPNVSKIIDHVKDRSRDLEPFSLLVDHRGTLGPDEADVLFFTKDIPWQLIDFRETLKYNQEIAMAYNAIPQRQDWKPHLTLGYPETPAHPDDWDPVGDILAHHGVKGMKWGVRKATGRSEKQVFKRQVKSIPGAAKVNLVLRDKVNAKLGELNNRPEFKGKDLKKDKTLRKQYNEELKKMHTQAYKEAVTEAHGTSSSGKYTAVVKAGHVHIYHTERVKHADEVAVFALTFDANGFVTKIETTETAQGALMVDEILEHHGVRGMRWGVRRKNIGSPNEVTVSVDKGKLKAKGGEGHGPSEEAKAAAATKQKAKASGVHSLSNEEIQAAVTRMNLESNFKQATTKTKQTVPGQKFVLNLLKNTGNAQVQRVVNDQATKAVKKHIGV